MNRLDLFVLETQVSDQTRILQRVFHRRFAQKPKKRQVTQVRQLSVENRFHLRDSFAACVVLLIQIHRRRAIQRLVGSDMRNGHRLTWAAADRPFRGGAVPLDLEVPIVVDGPATCSLFLCAR